MLFQLTISTLFPSRRSSDLEYWIGGETAIRIYGITQHPVTHKYMMVLDFVRDGNLRDYLKNNFNDINWKKKLYYLDRKSTRLNSSHVSISYAVFCLKKKKK